METKLDHNKRNPFARKLTFLLGEVRITDGAEHALDGSDVLAAITRHSRGDWGEVDERDWKENDHAVENGYRLLSQYTAKNGTLFWVVTTSDRSATTVLLPEEY
jgi:hypothetical protein